MRPFSICRSKILIFSFHGNWALPTLFYSKTLLLMVKCDVLWQFQAVWIVTAIILLNAKRIFSAQFLRMELSMVARLIINYFWTCRQICTILVSLERKMNALYKCVKIKISWKVSIWLVLEGRVTYKKDTDPPPPHSKGSSKASSQLSPQPPSCPLDIL